MQVLDAQGRQKVTPGLPVGAVCPFYGTVVPRDWALCDGTGGTPDLRDRFILADSAVGAGTPVGASSPAAALTHAGAAVANHSDHAVAQPANHDPHAVTQPSAHSVHSVTQPAAHGSHDSVGAHTHDAHTTATRTAAGVAAEVTAPATHASQGAHCIDELTEILTTEGWKRWDEVSVGKPIATFNRAENSIEWQPVQDVLVSRDHTEMIQLRHRSVDMLLCESHTVIYRWGNRGKNWNSGPAGRVLQQLSGRLVAPSAGFFEPASDECEDISPELAEVLGWVIAEGHFAKMNRNGVILYQKAKNATPLLEALDRCGLTYKTGVYGQDHMMHIRLSVESSRLIRTLLPEGKMIPSRWLGHLSGKSFEGLLQGLIAGDGCVAGRNGTSYRYVTADELLSDRLQGLCVIHGYTTLKRFHSNGRGGRAWQLSIRPCTTISLHTKHRAETVPYNGISWCVMVPNQTIVARRNGTVLIIGNTHDAHSAHTGMAVDAHSVHTAAAVDAHSAHAGVTVDTHSAHSVTQNSAHSTYKIYTLAYIQRVAA